MTDLAQKHALHNRAPPSPQLSQDDLIRELAILDKSGISNETGLLSPIVSPKEDTNDVLCIMYKEYVNLIYWRIPGRSGLVLGVALTSLVLSNYYSLLYVIAAIFTITTGFNLIFVNLYNLIQAIWIDTDEFKHPYYLQIKNERLCLICDEDVDYYGNKVLDGLDSLIQKMLIQDTTSFIASLFIYYISSIISVKFIFGLFILGSFTIPYYRDKYSSIITSSLQDINTTVTYYIQVIHKAIQHYIIKYVETIIYNLKSQYNKVI